MSQSAWNVHVAPGVRGAMLITLTTDPGVTHVYISSGGRWSTPSVIVPHGGMMVFVINPEALPPEYQHVYLSDSGSRSSTSGVIPRDSTTSSMDVIAKILDEAQLAQEARKRAAGPYFKISVFLLPVSLILCGLGAIGGGFISGPGGQIIPQPTSLWVATADLGKVLFCWVLIFLAIGLYRRYNV